MMRFLTGFEKAEKTRNMEFTLQFLLTVDIFVTALTYYSTVIPGMHNERIFDLTFLAWMGMLTISIFLLNCTSVNVFAEIRIAYRILHLLMVIIGFYRDHVVLLPPYTVLYFTAELCYLVYGLFNHKMDYPGKWIAKFTDHCQKEKDNQPDETAHSQYFCKVAHEVVRKNCTIDEEFNDDLFEYHTAYEDDLLPAALFHPKGRSTFIV